MVRCLGTRGVSGIAQCLTAPANPPQTGPHAVADVALWRTPLGLSAGDNRGLPKLRGMDGSKRVWGRVAVAVVYYTFRRLYGRPPYPSLARTRATFSSSRNLALAATEHAPLSRTGRTIKTQAAASLAIVQTLLELTRGCARKPPPLTDVKSLPLNRRRRLAGDVVD